MAGENKVIIVGADPGYGWNKYVFSYLGSNVWDKRIFPSLYMENPPEKAAIRMESPSPFSVEFDRFFNFTVQKLNGVNPTEEKFAVGKGVRDFAARITTETFSINRSPIMLKHWLFAILTMLEVTWGIEDFAVGLTVPIHLLNAMKTEFKKMDIKGTYKVTMERPQFKSVQTINIKSVYLLEQATSALYNEVYDIVDNGDVIIKNSHLPHETVAVIDIGTSAINFAIANNLDVIVKERMTEVGTFEVVSKIRDMLAKCGLDASYAAIQQKLIRDKDFIVPFNRGLVIEQLDFTKEVNCITEDVFNTVVEPAINRIRCHQANKNLKIDRILYTGGGVKLFSRFLKPAFGFFGTIISEYPQLANALGGWKTAYMYEVEKNNK